MTYSDIGTMVCDFYAANFACESKIDAAALAQPILDKFKDLDQNNVINTWILEWCDYFEEEHNNR